MIERVRDVNVSEQFCCILHDRHDAHPYETCAARVKERDIRGIDTPHEFDGAKPIFNEVARVRLDAHLYSFPFNWGSSSSIERQNWASLWVARSGRPLSSEFMTEHPRSLVIWMARFQYRTAARRARSFGSELERAPAMTEATLVPAASRGRLESLQHSFIGRRVGK